jgi:hypothetical protein
MWMPEERDRSSSKIQVFHMGPKVAVFTETRLTISIKIQ